MSKINLITIGHVIKEFIRFPDRQIGPILGSPAAYSAVTARRLGVETGIVSHIGKDMPPALLQPLRDAEIDLCGIKVDGEDSRTTILNYDVLGNKTVQYEKTAPPILFHDIPDEYLSADAALICPMDFEVPLSTIQALSTCHMILMADLGGFGGTVATTHPFSIKAEDNGFLIDLVKYCSIIKASIEDCQYLFGADQNPVDAGNLLLQFGAKLAIITLGKDGSLVFTGRERYPIPSFPSKVVDTTGAGDAFCGAFLVEYIKSHRIEEAAYFASAASSIMIEESGGVQVSRMPTVEMVMKRLAGSI